jgi:hypothetical protein
MVDLLNCPADRKAFCKEMNLVFQCRDSQCNPEVRNCDIYCPFKTAVDVQKWCNEYGISIRAAIARWAVKTIDEPMKLAVLADALGVSIRQLKELIGILRKAKEGNDE